MYLGTKTTIGVERLVMNTNNKKICNPKSTPRYLTYPSPYIYPKVICTNIICIELGIILVCDYRGENQRLWNL